MSLPVNPPPGPVSLSSNARTVLEKRYLVKNEKGKPVEQPEDLFWRVATVVAEADRRYGASDSAVQQTAEQFYALMTQRRFTLVRHLMDTRPWDFFMFVEMGTDRIHHGLWKFMDAEHRKHPGPTPLLHAIRDYYRYLDHQISDLLRRVASAT